MIENPLVSVVVVTYNSSNTILGTLDSILSQTYQNLELIVSDDCSTDETVRIVKSWLGEHKERFVSTNLITTRTNTGTAGNLNRGYSRTKGEWIKSIAGDDQLINTCIESNVNYIKSNPKNKIILSKVSLVGDSSLINKYKTIFNYATLELNRFELLYLLLVGNFLPASTLFINRSVYEALGGYDESMPLLEDWPFWIKAVYNNESISLNNDYTVFYRMSDNSVSLSSTPNPLYVYSLNIFYNSFLPKFQWKTNKLIWLYYKCHKIRLNKSLLSYLFASLLMVLNPITYYIKYLHIKTNRLNYKYL